MLVKIVNNKLVLNIKDIDLGLSFSLGAGIELEKKYDSIDSVYKALNKIQVCVDIGIVVINEAIKRYNRDYNRSIEPINEEWLVDHFENGLNSFVNINSFKMAIINLILDSTKGAEGNSKSSESKKKIN